MLISSDLLLHFQRCRRRAFLDTYGDARRKAPSDNFLLKLREDSQAYRELELANYPGYAQPKFTRGNWRDGAAQTLELMRSGVECIYRGVLMTPWREDVELVATPDLLVRVDTPSELGDWSYVCKDIRFGKRPKLDYQIVSVFHGLVLAGVQGVWPDAAEIALRDRGSHAVSFEHRTQEMFGILSRCVVMLRDRQEPDLFLSRQKCSLCHWHADCHRIALRDRHLSLLPGVTPNRFVQLAALGLQTIEDILKLPFDRLVLSVGPDNAAQIFRQAQANFSNLAIPLTLPISLVRDVDRLRQALADPRVDLLPEKILPLMVAEAFPDRDIELHFDIEAEPDRDVDFLLGVLEVNRRTGEQQFHAFLAEIPEEEGRIWEEFIAFMLSRPEAPIYHFCDYEVKTIARLAQRYGTPPGQWQVIVDRCVDLHWWATKTVVMPVESYSLKAMARWLGFEWRDPRANGAQCICWYNEWLETADRDRLAWIVDYNEDDCRATYQLKIWLEQFLRLPAMTAQVSTMQNPAFKTDFSTKATAI